jgi:hypothetical protein
MAEDFMSSTSPTSPDYDVNAKSKALVTRDFVLAVSIIPAVSDLVQVCASQHVTLPSVTLPRYLQCSAY